MGKLGDTGQVGSVVAPKHRHGARGVLVADHGTDEANNDNGEENDGIQRRHCAQLLQL